MLKRIKLAHFKTLPKKKWGFFRSFFDDTRGYHVRKPSLGMNYLKMFTTISLSSFKVRSLSGNEQMRNENKVTFLVF